MIFIAKGSIMRIVKILLICLCTALVLLCCVGCRSDQQQQNEEPYSTEVKNVQFAAHGDYVYADWGKIYRFDRATETFTIACTDPDCYSHRCPLECAINYFAGVVDGKVYFSSVQQFTHNFMLSYLNIETGECVTIKTMSEAEDPGIIFSFVEDGWWYYPQKILKDGGLANNANDYELWMCKISLDGQNDKPIRQLRNTETIQTAGAGKVVTFYNGALYTTDVQSGEVYELYSLTQNGFMHPYTNLYYLNGKIYFLAASTTTVHSDYTQQSYPLNFLLCIDLTTNEVKQILDQPLCNFCLTDDAIYYVPFELRHIYIPDDYQENPNSVSICLFEDALYKCDLDGEGSQKLYSNDQIDFIENFIVVEDTLYGWMYDYNEQTHLYDKTFFGAIELNTGRVIHTVKPQKEQSTQTEP